MRRARRKLKNETNIPTQISEWFKLTKKKVRRIHIRIETAFNSQFHFCPQSCSLIIQVGDDLQRPVVGSD